MTRPSLLLALVTFLATCGTPQEQCIRAGTRELRTVELLIAETGANLARGYALEQYEVTHTEWRWCYPPVAVKGQPASPPRLCPEEVTDVRERPVAIDPAAEQRKLKALKDRRARLLIQAEAVVASCKAQHPEIARP